MVKHDSIQPKTTGKWLRRGKRDGIIVAMGWLGYNRLTLIAYASSLALQNNRTATKWYHIGIREEMELNTKGKKTSKIPTGIGQTTQR